MDGWMDGWMDIYTDTDYFFSSSHSDHLVRKLLRPPLDSPHGNLTSNEHMQHIDTTIDAFPPLIILLSLLD
jgi:hypothetical protein